MTSFINRIEGNSSYFPSYYIYSSDTTSISTITTLSGSFYYKPVFVVRLDYQLTLTRIHVPRSSQYNKKTTTTYYMYMHVDWSCHKIDIMYVPT